MRNSNIACLVLQDGTSLHGRLAGSAKSVAGEVVFNTGMVGYTVRRASPLRVRENPGCGPRRERARVRIQPRRRAEEPAAMAARAGHSLSFGHRHARAHQAPAPCRRHARAPRCRGRGHRARGSERAQPRRRCERARARGLSGQRQDRGARGLRLQGEHPHGAPCARAHGDPRAVGLRLPPGGLRRRAGVERPRRSGGLHGDRRQRAPRARGEPPGVRHLPRPPAARACRRRAHLQAQVRPPRP
ncbi:MAG: hypothetical protein E6H63_09335 [Betaproteobacteria bacterium]|nr:MAG: hypothetical protein E6H63_09335 [Betaproteobacteria bacterium]